MSGGDFINSGERQRLLQRGIEDRVRMVRDLRRIMDARGAESAAIMLGCSGSGELFAIVERRVAIQAPLLEQLYGPRGGKLKDGLTSSSKPKVPAAPKVSVAKPASLMAGAKAKPATAAPAQESARATTRPGAAEAAEVLAIMKRASAGVKGTQRAATAMGMGCSTFYNVLHGHKPMTAGVAQLVRQWAIANPGDDDAARVSDDVGDDADRAEGQQVPPPAPVEQDAAAPGAAVVLSDGGTVDDADAGAGVADSGEAGWAPPRAQDADVGQTEQGLPSADQADGEALPGLSMSDTGEVALPLDPPPAQDSTVALSVQLHPPEAVADLPRAAVDGEAGLCLVPPPQTIEDPITAALAVLQAGIDAQLAHAATFVPKIGTIAAQIETLQEQREVVRAAHEAARREATRLIDAKNALQDLRA